MAITHDRYFLDNVAQWVLELDRGRAYPYEGNYTTYLETKEARMKVEGQKDAKRAKRLKEELEWVRMNAKGRQTKSKARLARYEEMAAEADYDKLLAEMGTLQEQLDHRNAWDLDSQLEQAMDALRCPPPEADVKVLSGGERRRVALCKLL